MSRWAAKYDSAEDLFTALDEASTLSDVDDVRRDVIRHTFESVSLQSAAIFAVKQAAIRVLDA